MVKPTQTIRLQKTRKCLSVFDNFVGLIIRNSSSMLENLTLFYHYLEGVYITIITLL